MSAEMFAAAWDRTRSLHITASMASPSIDWLERLGTWSSSQSDNDLYLLIEAVKKNKASSSQSRLRQLADTHKIDAEHVNAFVEILASFGFGNRQPSPEELLEDKFAIENLFIDPRAFFIIWLSRAIEHDDEYALDIPKAFVENGASVKQMLAISGTLVVATALYDTTLGVDKLKFLVEQYEKVSKTNEILNFDNDDDDNNDNNTTTHNNDGANDGEATDYAAEIFSPYHDLLVRMMCSKSLTPAVLDYILTIYPAVKADICQIFDPTVFDQD